MDSEMRSKRCGGCGGPLEWDASKYPEPGVDHCQNCPPWACEDCGELTSITDLCSCWVSIGSLSHADVKALFAADGTFNVASDGSLSVGQARGNASHG